MMRKRKTLLLNSLKKLIYPNGDSKMLFKSIEFNFPIYIDGRKVRKIL